MASRSLLFSLVACSGAWAQIQQAQFNQVLNLNGDMNLNSFQFPDGTKIETFSQLQQQMIVNTNPNPLSASMVTGSTGNPFMALQQNSIVVQTNNATSLVGAQMEMNMNVQAVQAMGANVDNTYVAKLSADRQTWQIQSSIRTVNSTDQTTRMVKMNVLDGEYQVLARMTTEVDNSLTPFGTAGNSVVNIQGSGINEFEFTDGFRMSIKASQPLTMNTQVKNGVSTGMLAGLAPGTQSVNNYRYLVTTNLAGVQPGLNGQTAVVQLPVNAVRLQSVAQQMGATAGSQMILSIAQRPILGNPGGATGQLQGVPGNAGTGVTQRDLERRQNTTSSVTGGATTTSGVASNPAATSLLLSPTFQAINQPAVFDALNRRIAIPVGQIDGEYIINLQMANGQTAQTPQGQAPQAGQTPQGQAPQAGTPGTAGAQPAAQPAPQGAQPAAEPAPQAAQPAAEPAPQAAQPAAAAPSTPVAEAAPPAGSAPAAGAEPAPAAAAAAAPSAEPARAAEAAPAREPAPAAAAEPAPVAAAAEPAPAAEAAPAAEPAPAAAGAEPASAGSVAAENAASLLSGVAKRQTAGQPLLNPTAQQAGAGVLITMDQIDQMATIQNLGSPIQVGQMLSSVSANTANQAAVGSTVGVGALTPPTGASGGGLSVAGAGTGQTISTSTTPIGGIKKRWFHFRA